MQAGEALPLAAEGSANLGRGLDRGGRVVEEQQAAVVQSSLGRLAEFNCNHQNQIKQDYNATYRSHCKLRTLCDRMYMWSHRL